MKTASLIIAFLLAVPLSSNASTQAEERLVAAAVKLNAQSQSSLGISVRALSILISAHSPHLLFFRKDTLVEEGSWPFVKELETSGYATVRVVTGVPNGQPTETEQVTIQLTDKGKVLASALATGA